MYVDNTRMNFHVENARDHIAMMKVYNVWKEINYSTTWRFEGIPQLLKTLRLPGNFKR